MRTLADVKRKMELGSNWHCVRLSGGNEDMGVREVGKVQGNAVAFLSGGKLSWLWWPKAKDVQVPYSETGSRHFGTPLWNRRHRQSVQNNMN